MLLLFTLKSHTGTSSEALRLRTLHPGSLLPKQRRVTTISRYLIAKVQIKLEIKKNLAIKIVLQQKMSQNIWNFCQLIMKSQFVMTCLNPLKNRRATKTNMER